MPSDDLNEPGTETRTEGAEGTAEGGREATAPTLDDFRQALGAAIQEAQGPLAERLQEMQERVSGLEQTPAGPAQSEERGAEVADLATDLLTSPEATLNKFMNDWAKQNLGPALTRDYEVARDERVTAEGARFDQRFGEGAFDEWIRPALFGERDKPGSLSAFSINHQADPRVIQSCIAAAVGQINLDPERQAKWEEAQTTVRKNRERDIGRPPGTLAPGGPGSAPQRLSPELEEGIAHLQAEGYDISKKSIMDAQRLGGSWESWQKHLSKAEGGA